MPAEKILILDDDELFTKSIKRHLRNDYDISIGTNGKEGLTLCEKHGPYQVIISDYLMPQMDGLTFLSMAKTIMPDAVRMLLSGSADLDMAIKAINDSEVYKLLIKPIEVDSMKKALNSAISQHRRILAERELIAIKREKKALEGSLHGFIRLIEARDPYTAGHQHRVSLLASKIAHNMNMESDVIKTIYLAASIHDIGKLYVPSEFLNKPGKLTDLEFDLIKTHPQVGYEVLKQLECGARLANIIHQHHEAINGTGYPQGLSGDQILIEAKIIAVADVIEAMSSHRPYRPALGVHAAITQIKDGSGILYDQEVVRTCLDIIGSGWSFNSEDIDTF